MFKQVDPTQLFVITLFFLVFFFSIREAMYVKFGKPAHKQPRQGTNHQKGQKDNRGLFVRLWAALFRGAKINKPQIPNVPKPQKQDKKSKDQRIKELMEEGDFMLLEAAKRTWNPATMRGNDGKMYQVLISKDKSMRVVWYMNKKDELVLNDYNSAPEEEDYEG